MTVIPHVTFLGALLALIFCSAMFTLLWWMLHPPPAVSQSTAKATIAVSAIHKILVPTTGTMYSEKAVELACRLGREQKAEIIITYVIEVPFTLPLNADMGKTEIIAKEALKRGVEIVQHHHLPVATRIERARKAADGLIRLVKEIGADLIVIGIRPLRGITEKIMGRTSETVLRNAPCEVIVDRRPE
jgi:nucleotide-binding universal stress UspA family protein